LYRLLSHALTKEQERARAAAAVPRMTALSAEEFDRGREAYERQQADDRFFDGHAWDIALASGANYAMVRALLRYSFQTQEGQAVVQVLGGLVEAVSGLLTLNPLLYGLGLDQVQAGATTLVTGTPTPTLVFSAYYRSARALGADEDTARGLAGLLEFATHAGANAGLGRLGSPAEAGPFALGSNCFVAGTPLLTPQGARPVECFHTGDMILSRAQHDPDGPIEAKVVENVFVRVASIWVLQVREQVIRTTCEHPFYVRGQGWRCTQELKPADQLLSHDGQWVAVEAVAETGEVTTVYNLRVANHHTYFVGCEGWGFSVWAHNAEYTIVKVRGARQLTIIDSQGEVIGALASRREGIGFTSVEAAQAWAKENLGDSVITVNAGQRVFRPTPPHTEPIGQIHHPISRPIQRELENHRTLKGTLKREDYATQAWDEAAHASHDSVQRAVDKEVIAWILDPRNEDATPEEFLTFLRWRYSQPDMKARFPNGF
jgi:hypothetical protein